MVKQTVLASTLLPSKGSIWYCLVIEGHRRWVKMPGNCYMVPICSPIIILCSSSKCVSVCVIWGGSRDDFHKTGWYTKRGGACVVCQTRLEWSRGIRDLKANIHSFILHTVSFQSASDSGKSHSAQSSTCSNYQQHRKHLMLHSAKSPTNCQLLSLSTNMFY